MNGNKFRLSNSRLSAAQWTFAGFFVFGLLGLFAIYPDFMENVLRNVLVALCVSFVFAVLVFALTKDSYIRILDDGFEVIKGTKTDKYKFTDFAGSSVVRNYYNGIYTGTTREIKIHKDRKKLTVNANALSRERFAELVSYLGECDTKRADGFQDAEKMFDEKKIFSIPKESIVEANRKKFVNGIIVLGVFVVISIAAIILKFTSNIDPVTLMIIAIMSAIVFGFLLVSEFFTDFITYKKVCNIPHVVSMDWHTLTVGDDVFSSDSIKSVSMVPGNYEILARDMIIITKNGDKYKYCFGKNKDKKCTYEDYSNMCDTIRIWCFTKDVSYLSILG